MSIRSLGYVLTRRFYPRKIYSLQAGFLPGIVSQAASVPAAGRLGRSLHSVRDLSTGENSYSSLFAAALAGGLGILIFKNRPDVAVEPEDNNVTSKDSKEVLSKKPEVTDNKLMQVVTNNIEKWDVEVTDKLKMEVQDMDMEVRFHEWKKWVGRVYPNQEEETRRFELFKESVNDMDSQYEGKPSAPYLPNLFADMTIEEIHERLGYNRRDPKVLKEHEAACRALKELEMKLLEKAEKEEKEKGASTAAKKQ